jgi:hypothetical protein
MNTILITVGFLADTGAGFPYITSLFRQTEATGKSDVSTFSIDGGNIR